MIDKDIHTCKKCKRRINYEEGYCLHCGEPLEDKSEKKEVTYIQ